MRPGAPTPRSTASWRCSGICSAWPTTRTRRRSRVSVIRLLLKESAPRAGFFEAEQYAAVRRRLRPDLQLACDLGYHYGWRMRDEILPLQWRQVDLCEVTSASRRRSPSRTAPPPRRPGATGHSLARRAVQGVAGQEGSPSSPRAQKDEHGSPGRSAALLPPDPPCYIGPRGSRTLLWPTNSWLCSGNSLERSKRSRRSSGKSSRMNAGCLSSSGPLSFLLVTESSRAMDAAECRRPANARRHFRSG